MAKNLYVKTFGCQMNVHDSERIVELMGHDGYITVDEPGEADVFVINSCSVREKAWHKAISEAGRARHLKKRIGKMVVVVTGCVAQQEGDNLFKLLGGIDLVVGPDHYRMLPGLVAESRAGNGERAQVGFDDGRPEDFLPVHLSSSNSEVTAFVTVMKGCSERCHYCIVPSVRGPERSRPAADIVEEARSLVAQGCREITLLGQKVNSYQVDATSFAGLLRQVDQIDGLHRVRFTSPHPRHMTEELIGLFGNLRTLCESIHLPVQTGSDRTLKAMRRRYTMEHYRSVVKALREHSPGLAISTDLIVGYPGETEVDFQETLDLLEEVRFSGVFSFKYSVRPGTRAAELEDDVPDREKARRLAAVHEVVTRIDREIREELVGSTLEVLVEGTGRNQGQLSGRARNSQIVNFTSERPLDLGQARGKLYSVRVNAALPHSLEGHLEGDEDGGCAGHS